MSVMKKWKRWQSKRIGNIKRSKRLRLIITTDDLHNAKRPPDWLIELQEDFSDDTKTA